MSPFKTVYFYKNLGYQKKLYSKLKKRPEDNTELLVTGIPTEVTVYDLALFFEQMGELFHVKLFTTADGLQNKGFGYVKYFTKSEADKAQETLSETPFKGVYLSLYTSIDNCRLFIWGIPKDKTKNNVWQALINTYKISNILDVLVPKDSKDLSKNRGYAILEFGTHEEASNFKENFVGRLSLFNEKLNVLWAKPVSSKKSEVTTLLVRNLKISTTSEQFARLIYSLIGKDAVQRVYKVKDYAFVCLRTRTQAESLMAEFNRLFSNSEVEIQFANPMDGNTDLKYKNKTLEQHIGVSSTKKSSAASSLSLCDTNEVFPSVSVFTTYPEVFVDFRQSFNKCSNDSSCQSATSNLEGNLSQPLFRKTNYSENSVKFTQPHNIHSKDVDLSLSLTTSSESALDICHSSNASSEGAVNISQTFAAYSEEDINLSESSASFSEGAFGLSQSLATCSEETVDISQALTTLIKNVVDVNHPGYTHSEGAIDLTHLFTTYSDGATYLPHTVGSQYQTLCSVESEMLFQESCNFGRNLLSGNPANKCFIPINGMMSETSPNYYSGSLTSPSLVSSQQTSSISSRRTTPYEDDLFTAIDFEDMVRKLVEDD